MDCNKKPLSSQELLQEAEAISSESENEFKEYFDSDDSLGNPDCHTHSSGSSQTYEEDLYVDEVFDNIGSNRTVIPEWKKVTENSQKTFKFEGNEGLNTNLPTTSSFSEIDTLCS